jgi:uncharacterized membrane protein (UPF0136 family)
MNWKLILQLSGFGLAMAIGTVYVIPSNIEPIGWLLVFLICAYVIAKQAPGKYFLHGLAVSLVNSIWVTGAHVALASTYMERHPDEVAMMAKMPLAAHPRLMMLLTGPVVGLISGLVLGLFAFIASKIVRRT